MDSQTLALIGGVIAGLTAIVKYAIPLADYPKWVPLTAAGVIAALVLGIAVTSDMIPLSTTPFDLLTQWVNFVLVSIGVREVVTAPAVGGKTLSDLPTRSGTGSG